jgi:hypothetical protein
VFDNKHYVVKGSLHRILHLFLPAIQRHVSGFSDFLLACYTMRRDKRAPSQRPSCAQEKMSVVLVSLAQNPPSAFL